MNEQQTARALGWFSIGLGLAEIFATKQVGRAAGLSNHNSIVRIFGARELAAGLSILANEDRSPGMWSRVAGDAMDLAGLGAAMKSAKNGDRSRLAIAAAAVAGITVLDYLVAQKMTSKHATPDFERRKDQSRAGHVKKVTIINRPAEELYKFWRNFENLPRFMEHLVSVKGGAENQRSRWIARAPGGATVEWDAEIVNERQNELIAWRSLPGSDVANAGSVRFEPCPDGRGTFVKIELEYDPPGGQLGAKFARLFGEAPEQQIADDLRRFKQLMETGEVSTTKGQPAGRRSSISRRYDKTLKSWASV
jgi:uncharacterized membrane protein